MVHMMTSRLVCLFNKGWSVKLRELEVKPKFKLCSYLFQFGKEHEFTAKM